MLAVTQLSEPLAPNRAQAAAQGLCPDGDAFRLNSPITSDQLAVIEA